MGSQAGNWGHSFMEIWGGLFRERLGALLWSGGQGLAALPGVGRLKPALSRVIASSLLLLASPSSASKPQTPSRAGEPALGAGLPLAPGGRKAESRGPEAQSSRRGSSDGPLLPAAIAAAPAAHASDPQLGLFAQPIRLANSSCTLVLPSESWPSCPPGATPPPPPVLLLTWETLMLLLSTFL